MKTDYKVGDRVEVIKRKYSHEFGIGHIGVITEIAGTDNCLSYCIDDDWWVSFEEIKPAPIDLNAKEPFFINGDVQAWVWDDPKYAKKRYLYYVDNRCRLPYVVWVEGKTMKERNNNIIYTTGYKNASFTNPNEPEKTIIIDGEKIKVSAESFNNLKDFFSKGWSEDKSK